MTKLEIASLIDDLRATAKHRLVAPAQAAADQLRAEHKLSTEAPAAFREPVRAVESEPAPKVKPRA